MPAPISDIIARAISIIELEVSRLAAKQEEGELSKLDADRLTDILKVLVLVERDRRVENKEQSSTAKEMTDEELEAALEAEYQKLQAKKADAK